ncbi:hypothetical protein [Baekduia sp. Peel2402]|uniref:hypothetical protein n=1 Tax=Baekduia sp. Peel2402 TaxID=3458296 RepID=UPI00403E393A
MDVQVVHTLDWKTLEVHPMFAGGFQVVIRGETPWPMRVVLEPLPIGIVPEDYYGVKLVGYDEGPVHSDVVTPFEVEKDLAELPHGLVGVVIIGATMRAYIPPKAARPPR